MKIDGHGIARLARQWISEADEVIFDEREIHW